MPKKENKESSIVPYNAGDFVTFLCKGILKEGFIVIVDVFGTFECPNIPSYDIMVESDNILYKHVRHDEVNIIRLKETQR